MVSRAIVGSRDIKLQVCSRLWVKRRRLFHGESWRTNPALVCGFALKNGVSRHKAESHLSLWIHRRPDTRPGKNEEAAHLAADFQSLYLRVVSAAGPEHLGRLRVAGRGHAPAQLYASLQRPSPGNSAPCLNCVCSWLASHSP